MFTTATGFLLVLMIKILNSITIFLSGTTISSQCNSLSVSEIVLKMNPEIKSFFFFLILTHPYIVEFYPLLHYSDSTIQHLYHALSCQVFRTNSPHRKRRAIFSPLVPLTGCISEFLWYDFCFGGRGSSECTEIALTEVIFIRIATLDKLLP